MSEQVWVTRIMNDYDLWFALRSKAVLENDSEQMKLEAQARNEVKRGRSLPQSRFPAEMYIERDLGNPEPRDRFPDFFVSGIPYISAAFAKVLSQFNLGNGAFYPVSIYQQDRKNLFYGDYFHLNVGTTKSSLLPEDSPGIEKSQFSSRSRIVSVLKDDDLCLTQAALTDADLWIENGFWDELFLSDRLFQALQGARLNVSFDAKRCRILS